MRQNGWVCLYSLQLYNFIIWFDTRWPDDSTIWSSYRKKLQRWCTCWRSSGAFVMKQYYYYCCNRRQTEKVNSLTGSSETWRTWQRKQEYGWRMNGNKFSTSAAVLTFVVVFNQSLVSLLPWKDIPQLIYRLRRVLFKQKWIIGMNDCQSSCLFTKLRMNPSWKNGSSIASLTKMMEPIRCITVLLCTTIKLCRPMNLLMKIRSINILDTIVVMK